MKYLIALFATVDFALAFFNLFIAGREYLNDHPWLAVGSLLAAGFATTAGIVASIQFARDD